MNKLKSTTFKQRGAPQSVADENKNQQITGLIGQTIVQDLLVMQWIDGINSFDHGVEFSINNQKDDVKTIIRTVPMREYLVHKFISFQKDFDVDF